MKDPLGDRMKAYESVETAAFMPLLPICVRLDGKCFSKLTKEMRRPFSSAFSSVMRNTTAFLVRETNACIGYTQSDEITLVFYSDDPEKQVFFGGKRQKIVSVLASMATAAFADQYEQHFGSRSEQYALFDCRAWQVPTLDEAANAVLWREFDATKNSVSMLARHHFSHKSLHGLTSTQMKDKLRDEAGVMWDEQPTEFTHGSYFQRRKIMRPLDEDERLKIPERFRPDPGQYVERTDVLVLNLPPLSTVENRVDVLIFGADPVIRQREI